MKKRKRKLKAHWSSAVTIGWEKTKTACGRVGLATGDPDAFLLPSNGPVCKTCHHLLCMGRV